MTGDVAAFCLLLMGCMVILVGFALFESRISKEKQMLGVVVVLFGVLNVLPMFWRLWMLVL